MATNDREELLHQLLNLGENMLACGGEVSRVEGTLKRMGNAYGTFRMNVFVITSSMVITMSYPDREDYTQTRRISDVGTTDFQKLEAYNALSRQICRYPVPVEELRQKIKQVERNAGTFRLEMYLGCLLGAGAFAMFFGGNIFDGIVAGLLGLFVRFLQEKLRPYCSGRIIYHAVVALFSGLVIALLGSIIPGLHLDKILIGDIMLMIPGIAMTSSVRDVFVGDTIAGFMRLVETLLWAAALAGGIMLAMTIVQLVPSFADAAAGASEGSSLVNASPLTLALIQLVTGALGSLGFAMMFHLRKELLVWATLGGILCWGVYLLTEHYSTGIFLPCLIASAACGLYGEVLARVLKVPATILFIPSMVPLIPGGSLYYTMAGVVQSDWASALFYCGRTIQFVLSIAVGFSIIWALFFMIRRIEEKNKKTT